MKRKSVAAQFKAEGLGDGQFEAIVSVFGNVDSYGDRVVKGAFAEDLERWKASGDPIPIIWSHRWEDPNMHIGYVLDAEERAEGLWVRGQLDTDDATAMKVHRLMKGRRVTQFSFAYDIHDAASITEDGDAVYELRKLALFEVGPTLVGVNQDTELLDVKSAESIEQLIDERVKRALAELAKNGEEPGPSTEPRADEEPDAKSEEDEEPKAKLDVAMPLARPEDLAVHLAFID